MSHRVVRPETSAVDAPEPVASLAARSKSGASPRPAAGGQAAGVREPAGQGGVWYEHMRLAAYFPNDPDTLDAE